MKNLKSLLVLSAFALLLLAANLTVWFGAGETKALGRRMLVGDVENLQRVRLERKGAPTVELGRAGNQWRLRSPYAGSVDEQVVMRFLDELAMTPIMDVISDSALLKLGRTRADFSLADPLLRVVLSDEEGERESIGFGAVTPLPGGVYVSIDDRNSVFVVSSNILGTVDIGAERFRRRALFAVGIDAVASFGIKRKAEASLEFVRGDSEWKVGATLASAQKVRDFLSQITAAEALDFIWPVGASNETDHVSTALLVGYGLDPDAAVTVSLKGVDGEERRISFGKADERGRVYALVHGGTAIVTVPAALKGLAEQDENAFADARLFPFEAGSVGSFSVADRDVRYAFVREKGEGWSLESPIVAKADAAVVDSVLSRILALSASDLVASSDGVAVSLSTNVEKSVVSRASVFGKAVPEDFRSKEIIRINPAHVRRLVRIEGDGAKSSAVVYDRERKAWNAESESAAGVADDKGVSAVLSAVNPLVASRIEKLKVPAADLDDYGLDTPFLTVAVDQDTDGAVRRNVIIGKKTKGGRFATVGSSDAVFVIGDELLERLSAPLVGK